MVTLTKKTIVLKQFEGREGENASAKGLLKIESFNGKRNASLWLTGAPCGNKFDPLTLFLVDELFNCAIFEVDAPKFEFEFEGVDCDSVVALLFEKNHDKPTVFGCAKPINKITRYVDYYVQNYAKQVGAGIKTAPALLFDKAADKTGEGEGSFTATDHLTPTESKIEYNDEAVAERNYYAEHFETEAHQSKQKEQKEIENEQSTLPLQDADAYCKHSSKTQTDGRRPLQNDDDSCACPLQVQRQPAFFKGISQKIESLFEKHPPLESLAEVIENSRWIKIDYTQNSHYVVGIVCQNNLPCHIIYGVPGNRLSPPKGFSDYSHFVPKSLFGDLDEGYWCAFQDADSGDIVK